MTNHSLPRSNTSTQSLVSRPTRGSELNKDLTNETSNRGGNVLFPSLDNGITLLDIDSSRGVPILQSLILDQLLLHDGPAFWIDANGHATTTTLAQITPSQRLLDRIHVARGFTAYQHYGAVCDLPTAINKSIQESIADTKRQRRQSTGGNDKSRSLTPSLIVAPAVDAQYRAEDSLSEKHAETLQARTLARLAAYAESYDAPVLITRSSVDEFTEPVARIADHNLECKQTKLGPRFVGDDFETLLYPTATGLYYQTTLAYWQQLLDTRAAQVGLQPVTPSPSTTSDAGSNTTTTNTTPSIKVNPLRDAWAAGSHGGR